MPYPRLTKCMPDETRHNPFYFLHKALRYGHCRMLPALGAQDFASPCTAQLLARLNSMMALSRMAAEGRRQMLESAPPIPDCLAAAQDVDSHAAALAELESLIRAVNVATDTRRNFAGRTLYRCYALFAAADMARMNAEETALLTSLHRALDDRQLQAMEAQLFQALGPGEIETCMQLMPPALGPAERPALLAQIEQAVGPEVFASLRDTTLRPLLSGATAAA